ncbi:hypothetical protein XA68_12523 [Ophiocordyceps unilateralis]|uniref:Uncharacterized protein n=1 Tax=Ophiocordyceps unilateralis TaxID=268505 RepID=A0A2A9PP45_OPHUN|nr:hypothetical protein XA68_12523 [Ophiocordyceps unilateralis]
MSDSEETTETLSVAEVAALSDEQLAQFMQKHRRHNGNFSLPVDGWDKLSSHDRSQLAERLKAQQRILSQNPASHCPPLDLDQLDARLRQASDGADIVPQAQGQMQGRTTPPYTEEEQLRDLIDEETEAYNDLVSDGGRPLYPISLIEQVGRKPEEHRNMLWPFWDYPGYSSTQWLVFRQQLKRWQAFRKWQIDNRGLEDDDGGFPAFIETMKRIYAKDESTGELAKLEADPLWMKDAWLVKQRERRWQQRWQRERGCNTFSDYGDAVKRRLARHGFTRSFELQEDPQLQDRLTTWIEYLCFEYWWFDRHTDSIERLKLDHDRRWQALVDKKIPKPQETKDFVRTSQSAMEREREIDQARQAIRMAEANEKRVYFLTQEDPQRLTIPEARRIQMLGDARKQSKAAQEWHELIYQRGNMITDFIRATFGYVEAQKDAAYHATIAQWVLEQVPLVRAELIQPDMTEASPDTKNRKRKRAQDEDNPEEWSSKMQKPGHREITRLPQSS